MSISGPVDMFIGHIFRQKYQLVNHQRCMAYFDARLMLLVNISRQHAQQTYAYVYAL